MKNYALDEIDRNIIAALQEDYRISNKALATTVGVSEATVASRIDGLVAAGIIKFAVQKDVRAWGMPFLFVGDIYLDSPDVEDVINHLADMREIFSVAQVTGSPQIIIVGHCADLDSAEVGSFKKIREIEGIRRAEFSPILKTIKFLSHMGDLTPWM